LPISSTAVEAKRAHALYSSLGTTLRNRAALSSSSRMSTPPPSNEAAPIKILYVEDDERLAKLTVTFFETRGLVVSHVATGPDAITAASRRQFDLVLLDLNLPGLDGVEVCRALRQRQDVPIIMVTARREEADKVLGLESGADDYVTKPFSPVELVSRIRAVVRRHRGHAGPAQKVLRVGQLVLEPSSLRATLAGRDLGVTAYEFSLLRVLAERPGRALSREQLLDLAKGSAEDAFDRTIDVQVSRLRHKLGDDARQPRLLKTVRGYGYMLAVHEEE
jgi:two-component system, OmpR family, response regulator